MSQYDSIKMSWYNSIKMLWYCRIILSHYISIKMSWYNCIIMSHYHPSKTSRYHGMTWQLLFPTFSTTTTRTTSGPWLPSRARRTSSNFCPTKCSTWSTKTSTMFCTSRTKFEKIRFFESSGNRGLKRSIQLQVSLNI